MSVEGQWQHLLIMHAERSISRKALINHYIKDQGKSVEGLHLFYHNYSTIDGIQGWFTPGTFHIHPEDTFKDIQ